MGIFLNKWARSVYRFMKAREFQVGWIKRSTQTHHNEISENQGKEKKFSKAAKQGDFQWFRLCASTAGMQVSSLVRWLGN